MIQNRSWSGCFLCHCCFFTPPGVLIPTFAVSFRALNACLFVCKLTPKLFSTPNIYFVVDMYCPREILFTIYDRRISQRRQPMVMLMLSPKPHTERHHDTRATLLNGVTYVSLVANLLGEDKLYGTSSQNTIFDTIQIAYECFLNSSLCFFKCCPSFQTMLRNQLVCIHFKFWFMFSCFGSLRCRNWGFAFDLRYFFPDWISVWVRDSTNFKNTNLLSV